MCHYGQTFLMITIDIILSALAENENIFDFGTMFSIYKNEKIF